MAGITPNRTWLVVVITAVVIAGAIYWFVGSNRTAPPQPVASATGTRTAVPAQMPMADPALAPPQPSPAPRPEPPAAEPPPLNTSDAAARKDLLSLSADGALARWLVPDSVIRKWVAAVSAAADGNLVPKNRPFTNAPGNLKTKVLRVDKNGAKVYELTADNYQRYGQPVRALALVDDTRALALYQFWYPRLAQAYAELGVRDKNFHQVLLQAIDRVLAAPQPKQPIELIRPSVYYRFADKNLEKMSAIDKLMIRIGPANAARVKQKLRELKAGLEKIQPHPQ